MIFCQAGGEKMYNLIGKEKLKLNTIQKIMVGECSKNRYSITFSCPFLFLKSYLL